MSSTRPPPGATLAPRQRTPAARNQVLGSPNPRIIRLATPTPRPASRPPRSPPPRPPSGRAHTRPLDNRTAISAEDDLELGVAEGARRVVGHDRGLLLSGA